MDSEALESVEPLFGLLTDGQQRLIDVIGEVALDKQQWPVFEYLEWRLDQDGHDAASVLASLPRMSRGAFSYGLTRHEQGVSFSPEQRVQLTVAGAWRSAGIGHISDMYLRLLDALRAKREATEFNPLAVTTITIDGNALVRELGLDGSPGLSLLGSLIQSEPGTMHGSQIFDQNRWGHRPSSWLRNFRGITGVPDYVARVRAWRVPTEPTPQPTLGSPLDLAAALDYLSLAWHVRFGAPLLRLPNAERVSRLAFQATTDAEFDSRLSGLREILKGFDVPGLRGGAGRIPEFLTAKLPADAERDARVANAVATLQAVKHARDAGQHVEAAVRASAELQRLGLAYPITDYRQAWDSVTAHVVDALRILREELQA